MDKEVRPALERRSQVQQRTGLSTSALYALMADGMFPRPVKISAKAVAWRSEQIDAWIESRINAGQAQPEAAQ